MNCELAPVWSNVREILENSSRPLPMAFSGRGEGLIPAPLAYPDREANHRSLMIC